MSELEQFNWQGKQILIVEDDKPSTILLTLLLNKTKAKLLYATNGLQAIEIFKQNHKIDLILMDIKLEGINGLEAARIIHNLNPNVPIIAQTACVMHGDKEHCLMAGCVDYISKPIDAIHLLTTMDKYLSKESSQKKIEPTTKNHTFN